MESPIPSLDRNVSALCKGCVDVVSLEGLKEKLQDSAHKKKPLTIKAGFDPSSPDIHLGHTLLLRKLRQFQKQGHRVLFIIGDATARIGDPSGRSQTRPVLTLDQVKRNAETYQKQAFKYLDPKQTRVVYNSDWIYRLDFEQWTKLLTPLTVRQVIDRDDFQKRLNEGLPISMMELFYPILQAYDSVHVKADVEIGGTDQTFNLLLGRELQKAFGQNPQIVMTLPLLVGLDGKQKMSKSFGNHIGITEAPKEIYGKLMSVSDETMTEYYRILLEKDPAEFKAQLNSGELHPMDAKSALAAKVVVDFWGEKAAAQASEEFNKVFRHKEDPSESPLYPLNDESVEVYNLLCQCKLAASKSDAKRLVSQGAVSIGGTLVSDAFQKIPVTSKDQLIKVGKRRFARFKKSKHT